MKTPFLLLCSAAVIPRFLVQNAVNANAPQPCSIPAATSTPNTFEKDGARLFIVEMNKSWRERIRQRIRFPAETVQSRSGHLPKLGARVYTEFERFDEFSPLIIEGLLLEIIGEASRRQGEKTKHTAPRWLQDVEDLLTHRYSEPLTLEEIANTIGIHPVHLAQTFRKLLNTTVGERLREIRLENAREALKFTQVPIAQIAVRCGFSDQSHLSRLFKARFGTTPLVYRKSV